MADKPGNSPAENAPANVDTTTGEVVQTDANRPSFRFRQWVQSQAADGDNTDSWDVTARQLDKVLVAQTYEEIMDADAGGTVQGRDLVDCEFEIPAQKLRYANTAPEFDAPLGIYIQFTATVLADFEPEGLKVGDEILVSTGAPLVIGKLRTLQANGFLPARVVMKGYHAGQGTVLKLRPAPNRSVSSTTTA